MRLSDAKRKYRNQWIAFKYTNRDKKLGKVLFHDSDRHRFDAKLLLYKGRINGTYLTYTGKPLSEKMGWRYLLCTK